MSNKEISQSSDRVSFQGQSSSVSESANIKNNSNHYSKTNSYNTHTELFCFNCKEKGHPYLKCPKPLIQCEKCRRFGHKAENCAIKIANCTQPDGIPKTMRIITSESNSKFIKEGMINNVPMKSFIDFGSEVTLITQSAALTLGLIYTSPPIPMRGFGNDIIQSKGGVDVELCIDGVRGRVSCQVVENSLLDLPLLVGQSFTEQPHVIVYKNAEELKFFDGNNEFGFPRLDIDDNTSATVLVASDVDIYGPAAVKARVSTIKDGDIMLSGKVIGRPKQQFIVNGGMYRVKDNLLYVYITPLSKLCQLREAVTIGRGTKIRVISRIYTSADSPVVEPGMIDVGQVK